MSIDITPLAGGQPHVAIVVLWYPLFTQPFIFREVENLASIMPIEVYSLYGLNLRHCSREMLAQAGRVHTYGAKAVFSVCGQALLFFLRRPRLAWRLFRQSLFYKWTSLEVFGENLWGFLVGISLGKRFVEDGIDFVYAPWPRGAATASRVGAVIAGLPYGISARGDNLEPADPDLVFKLRHAALIRANNAADQQRIEKMIADAPHARVDLVYNSLTLPPADSSHARSEKGKPARLLAVGRFDVTKGFDILLRACSILKKKNIPFHLTLAGGGGKVMGLGDMGSQLAALRQSLNLENEVSMPGLVSHDDLPAILRNHDIFAAPCVVHASGRRDGIPNTVIEALAYGLPVVSTNINALPEVVRDGQTGFAVPANEPEVLAEAIIKLIDDPALARKLGDNAARLAASMFDPGKNAVCLAAMFKAAWLRAKKGDSPCAA